MGECSLVRQLQAIYSHDEYPLVRVPSPSKSMLERGGFYPRMMS